MTTNQEFKHRFFQAAGGVTDVGYNEAVFAACTADGITSGTFNERLLQYLQNRTNTSVDNINNAMAAIAIQSGVGSWNELGESPALLRGLQLWLDSDDLSAVTKDGSDKVSAWSDKSGIGNDATQGTGVSQPTWTDSQINSKATIVFDGAADFLNIGQPSSLDFTPSTDEFTIFIVQQGDTSTSGTIISKAGVTVGARQYQFTNNSNILGSIVGGTQDDFADTITGAANILRIAISTTASNLHIDGAADSANPNSIGTAANGADVLIGARRNSDVNTFTASHLIGQIGEILIYNRLLSAAEITAVEAYLSTKWGIT